MRLGHSFRCSAALLTALVLTVPCLSGCEESKPTDGTQAKEATVPRTADQQKAFDSAYKQGKSTTAPNKTPKP